MIIDHNRNLRRNGYSEFFECQLTDGNAVREIHQRIGYVLHSVSPLFQFSGKFLPVQVRVNNPNFCIYFLVRPFSNGAGVSAKLGKSDDF